MFFWGVMQFDFSKFSALMAWVSLRFSIWIWESLNSFIFFRPPYLSNFDNDQLASIANGSNANLAKDFSSQVSSALFNAMGIIQESNILSSVVTVSTIIAVVAVFIKYGYVVLKTYFINVEGQTAAPTLDFFKRVLYVLIMCIVSPYLMFNGLFFASSVGLKVGELAISDVSNAKRAQVLFEIFSDEKKYSDFYGGNQPSFSLNADSYCDTDALKLDSESVGYGADSSAYKSKESEMIKEGTHVITVGGVTYDAYNVICLDSLNLVDKDEAVFKDRFGAGTGLERPMQWLLDTGATNLYTFSFGGFNGLTQLLTALVQLVAGLGITFMTAIRVVDLLSALIMMWFYAQAYVSEMQSNAIARFIQKVTSIWITQFYTVAVYGLYLANAQNSSSGSLVGLALNLALVSMMLKPPAALQDLLTPSGAANSALGAAKRVRGIFS